MDIINKEQPIWAAPLDAGDTSDRLDNNWYSPAAYFADLELHKALKGGKYKLMDLESMCEHKGIGAGVKPHAEGEIGLLEGRNLRPNYIIPIFTKFDLVPMDMVDGDLLIGKDGEPGTVATVTQSLLDYCQGLTVGVHVYHVRLLEKYRPLAPYISVFLNSRSGQALLRKCDRAAKVSQL